MAKSFSGSYDAILFDMDGTLVNSFQSIEEAWKIWCAGHGLDAHDVISAMHGCRAGDTIRKFLPGLTEAAYEAECRHIDRIELRGALPIPRITGALELISALPPDRWGITTSADRNMAVYRIRQAGLPVPDILVAGEDVEVGKPHPAGYRLAAKRLGVPAERCLVFEDTAVGLSAGHAAGADVVAIGEEMPSFTGPMKAWIKDYATARVVSGPAPISIFIDGH